MCPRGAIWHLCHLVEQRVVGSRVDTPSDYPDATLQPWSR